MEQLKLFYSFLFLTLISCGKSDITSSCELRATINSNLYNQTTISAFQGIENVSLENDCLSVTLTASGCDGSTWEIQMIDSGEIAESLPVQRFVKVFVTNLELCTAIVERTVTIDISDLKVSNEGSLILNIENYGEQIVYEY